MLGVYLFFYVQPWIIGGAEGNHTQGGGTGVHLKLVGIEGMTRTGRDISFRGVGGDDRNCIARR